MKKADFFCMLIQVYGNEKFIEKYSGECGQK